MIEIPGRGGPQINQKPQVRNNPTWTILVLSPPFFDIRGKIAPCMGSPLYRAALELLVQCYGNLEYRWQALNLHLERLLDERSALMKPSDHDRLLWDDEVFTRSRRYFWAIHCLAEFHTSINDNILQWENYRAARLDPVHEAGIMESCDLENIDRIERFCATLKAIRSYFAVQLEATKALRDGVSLFTSKIRPEFTMIPTDDSDSSSMPVLWWRVEHPPGWART